MTIPLKTSFMTAQASSVARSDICPIFGSSASKDGTFPSGGSGQTFSAPVGDVPSLEALCLARAGYAPQLSLIWWCPFFESFLDICPMLVMFHFWKLCACPQLFPPLLAPCVIAWGYANSFDFNCQFGESFPPFLIALENPVSFCIWSLTCCVPEAMSVISAWS